MRPNRAIAALCALAIALTACGDDDDAGADRIEDLIDDVGDTLDDDGGAAPVDGEDDSDGGSASGEVRPPEFVLTGPVEAPPGSVLDPASCDGPDESGPSFFEYYVPGDWIRRGSGSSGSGGVTMSGDHRYELPDGTSVELDIDMDAYTGTVPLDHKGGEWETWDFDIVEYTDAGEETTRITYDEIDPVEIDGEDFDLYHLDQAQSDLASLSEYKLRIVFGEVPTEGAAGQDRRPESATVTFAWNADRGDLAEAQAREVLSTFRLAECAEEGLVELYETLTGADFPD